MFWKRRKRYEHDLERELRSDLELEAEEQKQNGLSPEAARYAAQRAFGNTTLLKEEVREMWGGTSLEKLVQDARYGLRIMQKHWGVTFAALLTLALGVGANSAIFSVVNAVLIEPLPYPHSDCLMFLSARDRAGSSISFSYPDVLDWREQTQIFENLAAYQAFGFTLTAPGTTERLPGRTVSAEFFSTLGVAPALGRDFRPEDDRAGSHPVVILSDQVWRRYFQADPLIIGRDITLNSRSFTVVGILPATFQLYITGDVFAPIGLGLRPSRRGERKGIYAIGRLRPGITMRQAEVEADTVVRRLARQYPATNSGVGALIEPLAENFVGKTKPVLLMLLGAVSFVLLIACTNVANLLLARSASRQKEIVLRIALGAGRIRLLRQTLTENILLALISGACGLLLANWSLRAINTLLPENISRLRSASVNGSVLVFTLLASVVTAFLFGLAPALHIIGRDAIDNVHTRLRDAGQGSIAGRRSRSLLNFMIVSEVALSVVLLMGAGLMLRTLLSLQNVNPGFRAAGVLRTQIILPPAQYTSERQVGFFAQLVDRTRSLPGVQAASAAMCPPLSGTCWSNPIEIDGWPVSADQSQSEVNFNAIAPDYFRTLGISSLQGRDFDRRDVAHAPAVAIVNHAFVRRYFPGENPIGKRVRERSGENLSAWATVIGVVGDVRRDALDVPATGEVFLPFTQKPINFMTLVVHTSGNPLSLASAVRTQLHTLDNSVPAQAIGTMEQLQLAGISTRKLPAVLLGLFAGLALVLALVGIYGVIAYSVSQRTGEIGVRMALGAERVDVLRLVIAQGMTPVCVGLLVGVGAAFVLTRALSGVLYGVNSTDPLTLAAVSLLLAVTALLACGLPARRAARIDPIMALRYE
jgi:putative ABC transport system permease protein